MNTKLLILLLTIGILSYSISLREVDKIKSSLNLSSKNLSAIPDSCLNFQYKEIDIAFNQLKTLPKEWMAGQKDLEVLIASFNNLTEWPVINSKNRFIKHLDLQANHILSIPRDVSLLDSLKELSLKENKLTHLPEGFWNMSSLSDVKLSFNYIRKVSPPRNALAPLTTIDLQSNEIIYVSKELFMLPNLRYLNLADNHITKLPFDTIPKEMDGLVLAGNPISDEEKAKIMKHNPEAYFIMW